MILQNAETWEGCRTMSNDERRAVWAGGYYGAGYHRDDYTDETYATEQRATAQNEQRENANG